METTAVIVYEECIAYDLRHNADIPRVDAESIKT